jgi:CheY-like chemotaxis protein
MPEMTGIEFLQRSKEDAPDAKLVLLTAYADTDVAIKAINDIGLDHYLLKPWDPPEEQLYPVLDDLLDAWHEEHPAVTSEIRVVGHRWSDRSHEIKTFLARNHIPYRWLDVERDDEALRLLELVPGGDGGLPVVLFPDRDPLSSPSTLDLAAALGLRTSAEKPLYDLCIVGGRAGRRRVRRFRGSADNRGRARSARRAGRPERGDRELPRLPQGSVRRRPDEPRCSPGAPFRRRDDPGARRRRVRIARTGARGAIG